MFDCTKVVGRAIAVPHLLKNLRLTGDKRKENKMIERIIKANKRFVLKTASETHTFACGEVHNMRFGNEREFESLLGFDNFVLSNYDELQLYMSGMTVPVVEDEIPFDQQDSTKPELSPDETVATDEEDNTGNKVDIRDVARRIVEDGGLKYLEKVAPDFSNEDREKIRALVEEAEWKDETVKEKLLDMLKPKRVMSKCPVCGKRKRKDEPFCDVCTKVRDDMTSVGVEANI